MNTGFINRKLARIAYPAAVAVALALSGSLHAKAKTIFVTVNCNGGDSISKELEKYAGEPLDITVLGICNESVEISGGNVVLHGNDQKTDGIAAAAKGDALVIRDAANVEVRELRLSNGVSGLRVVRSRENISVSSLLVVDNAANGVLLDDATVALENVAIAENGLGLSTQAALGIGAQNGSIATCTGCVVVAANAAETGIAGEAERGSHLTFLESDLTGDLVWRVRDHSTVIATESMLESSALNGDVAFATNYARISVFSSTMNSGGTVRNNSTLELYGVTQDAPPGAFQGNFNVQRDSWLYARDLGGAPTFLDGIVTLDEFSRGRIRNFGAPSSIGTVICLNGSDVIIDAGVVGSGMGCPSAP